MIERDRRDRRRDRRRSTFVASSRPPRPTSSTADLDAGAAEQLERDRRRHLEERRLRLQHAFAQQLLDRGLDVGDGGDHRVCRDRPAVDDEPLGQIDEVRRRVARRPVAGRAQPGVDHRRDRALAVGAGDVDRSERRARDGRGGRRSRRCSRGRT